jgi:hypothetical protein
MENKSIDIGHFKSIDIGHNKSIDIGHFLQAVSAQNFLNYHFCVFSYFATVIIFLFDFPLSFNKGC